MKWLTTLLAAIALIGLPLSGSAQEHRSDHAAPAPRDGEAPAARADHPMRGHGMGGPGMREMPCPMMGQPGMEMAPMHGMSAGRPGRRGMGPGMSAEGPGMRRPRGGMMETMMPMPAPDADPKVRGRWMQMRGEMMKAMGDILMRYGRDLESGK